MLRRAFLFAAFALVASASHALAQSYPSRPIKIVVPYAAGGGTDALTRFVARGLEQRLGQPVIVENRGGSGTTLGGTQVARSEPDGYTLMMGTSSTFAMAPSLYKSLAYNPVKDFSPIMLVATVPFVLTVHPSLGVNTAQELIALAKSKPGQLSYASGGAGAPHHIYAELLMHLTGIDIKHVPYRGGGPALNDVVAGHVPIYFADVGPAAPLIAAGKLNALGVTTVKRADNLPDVPTLAEVGGAGASRAPASRKPVSARPSSATRAKNSPECFPKQASTAASATSLTSSTNIPPVTGSSSSAAPMPPASPATPP